MIDGFGLLVGHLIGDYRLQNDWMAKNKINPYPGPKPGIQYLPDGSPSVDSYDGLIQKLHIWRNINREWWLGHLACTIHCLLYTFSIWVCSCFHFPWWALLVCFLIHWPIDRFRLARIWMEKISGQKAFANGPFAPWSIIVVDNCFHLETLFVLKLLVEKFS